MTTDTLDTWNQLETTDPEFAKNFNRGGFRGTAINPCYVSKKLTELFGPCGIGWRFVVDAEEYREGHTLSSGDKAVVHIVRGHLEYKRLPDEVWSSTGPQFGQTTFVGENKNGPFSDEEAPKKSITDATTKCAALLGLSADIFSGKWDDNKYVNDRHADKTASKSMVAKKTPAKKTPAKKTPAKKTPPKKPSAGDAAQDAPFGLPDGSNEWLPEQWAEYLAEDPETNTPAKFIYETFLMASTSGADSTPQWEETCGAFADAIRSIPGGLDTDDGKRLTTALQGEFEKLHPPAAPKKKTQKRKAPKKKVPKKKAAATA